MPKKKSFEEFREENLKEQEKILGQIEDERFKQLQAQHCLDRAMRQVEYQKKKNDKRRVHRLITKGAAIEAICSDTKYLKEDEFYRLMDNILNVKELRFHTTVAGMVLGRQEQEAEKERKIKEQEDQIRQGILPSEQPDEADVLLPDLPGEED